MIGMPYCRNFCWVESALAGCSRACTNMLMNSTAGST